VGLREVDGRQGDVTEQAAQYWADRYVAASGRSGVGAFADQVFSGAMGLAASLAVPESRVETGVVLLTAGAGVGVAATMRVGAAGVSAYGATATAMTTASAVGAVGSYAAAAVAGQADDPDVRRALEQTMAVSASPGALGGATAATVAFGPEHMETGAVVGGLIEGGVCVADAVYEASSYGAMSRAVSEDSARSIYPAWPPNDGFADPPVRTALRVGTLLDRYGGDSGNFLAPAGTPFEQRSLPEFFESTQPFSVFEVLEEFEVEAGVAAPWFGQPGGGVQYRTAAPVSELIERGYLRRVE